MPLIFDPTMSPCHDYHKMGLSPSSQKILLVILKYKEPLYKGPVSQKEDYLYKEDKYLWDYHFACPSVSFVLVTGKKSVKLIHTISFLNMQNNYSC